MKNLTKISTFLIIFIFFSNISFSGIYQIEFKEGSAFDLISSLNLTLNHSNTKYPFGCEDTIVNKTILYRIPVKFWIYRNSKGKGSLSLKDMKHQIEYLNYFHTINNTGVSFYLRPDFVYIDNDRLFKLNYLTQAPLQTFLRHSKGCINVYVSGKLNQNRLFKNNSNYAGTYNRLTKGVLMANGVSSSTLTHETGHYFGLKHPHKNWKNSLLQEPVSRERKLFFSNKKTCEKRGDDLCDTPAEPNLDIYSDNTCRYTGSGLTDKYGDLYSPNTDNIMSYTQNRDCRNKFSESQKRKILYTISRNKYAQSWSASGKNASICMFDNYEPDDFKETASELFFNSPQKRTFHKIVSSKRKVELEDKTDWMFFEIPSNVEKNIKLIFYETEYEFPDIHISISFEDKLISEHFINKENTSKTIILSPVKQGNYYIKITKISTIQSISAYKIKLVK